MLHSFLTPTLAVLQGQPFDEDAMALFATLGIAVYGFGCIMMVVILVAQWKIVAKTGNHGALSLLMFVPFVGYIGLALWMAFSEWPIESENAELRARARSRGRSDDDWE